MTPNTMPFMIAGFTVVFLGIIFYVISLISRYRAVKRQLEMLADRENTDPSTETSSQEG